MNKTFMRSVSFLMAVMMVVGVFATTPFAAFAAGVDYSHNASTSTDEYYNLISKTDWDNAPGISESEIVLNNDSGTYRQVVHIMKADVNNSYVSVIPTYADMNTSVYQTATMLDQANWIDQNMEGEVIGVMNCCLSWYSGYPADRVGEPLGFMMMNGEIMFDPGNCGYNYGNVGFPTCVVINKDVDENGNLRPADIPKVEMPQIRSSADLDGWEETVIPVSSGYIVKEGVNQSKTASHSDAAPRSVVGITADGQVVMMENDGRQSPFSAGMNMYECAEVMIAAGCVWAANCDGGGSSTFVSQRPGEELKVVNSPSDGGLRPSTSGICFITTVPADGEFVRANVSAEGEYFTPGSSVQFSAVGADVAGGTAVIPEDAKWILSDDTFGTIDQSGLFVSSGKTGSVSAQIEYEGTVYGEREISIVVPDAIHFSQSVLTVPNGAQSSFSLSATYGIYEVVSKDSDFTVKLDNNNMGTLDGYVITATDDLSVTSGSITATLTHDSSVTATMEVVFGKASEVIWDFEDGFGTGWHVEHLQQRKNGNHAKPGISAYNNILNSYPVTSENGMVHDGNGAAAVYSDTTYGTLNWLGAALRWAGETVTYENAKTLGAWVYFPKDAVSVAVRFCFTGVKDGENIGIDAYPINYGDSLYFEESGWVYCAVDVSEYDSITLSQNQAWDPANPTGGAGARIEISCQLNGGTSGEYNWQTTPGVAGINTFFIDNLIVDYSEACDDREAPIFGEVQYVEPISTEDKYLNNQRNSATVTNYNNIGFAVNVTEDTTFVNATGLDAATARAYIDGNEVDCTFNGKNISIPATDLKNGVHTVKFTICDMSGNYASVIRKIQVNAENNDANIWIKPQTDAALVPTGSQYWIDVIAKNVENVEKVTLTLDLNNVNNWLLDHMVTLYGFSATYTTDLAGENLAYIEIERTGTVEASGEQAIVSIPLQTWEFKEETYPGYLPSSGGDSDLNGNSMYDPYECWNEFVGHNYAVIINPLAGLVEYTDNTTESFSGDKIQVNTERQIGCWWGKLNTTQKYEYFTQYDKSSWHLHSAGAPQDKAATCTEEGYIGRVFCTGCSCVTETEKGHSCDTADGCGAILVWGTTIPAMGHEYAVNADGKLACINGGELFNGVYTDGKTYVDGVVVADGWTSDKSAYYVDGVKLTGSHILDGVMYTFDENGVYLPDYIYDGWYDIDNTVMYFVNNKELTGYQKIETKPYYFDANGKGYEGEYIIDGKVCVFDNGLFVSSEDATVLEAGWCGADWNKEGLHAVEYIVYDNASIRITGKGDMMNVVEVGVVPWSNYVKSFIKSIFIGKDITRIGNHAFRNCFVANSIVFEEGSNLNYIGMRAFFNMRALKNVILPDGVEVLRKHAFGQTYNLQSIYLPMSLTTIEDDVFYAYKDCLVLEVEAGSSAEIYAKNKGIPYTVREIELKNGIYDEDGVRYYYVDGVRTNAGLVKVDGYYYYASSGGACKTGKYWVSRTNDLLKAGYYYFDAETSRMDIKNGVYAEDGGLYYYVDGVRTNAGLVKVDGYYYYASSGGACRTGKYWVSRTNDLLKAGYYYFDTETGRMDIKNGVYAEDGGLYYYVDGVRTNAGLVEVDGYYYYASSGGACKTGKYWVSRPNGLMPAGYYIFDAETGKMIF
ncbi:MAG: phosphodiester glycosidase family protein [Clostridia bacterium]|nr:phosphodiester glycosidase family protein [Clostridia bacterium]